MVSVQFTSVAQSCLTLCNPMDRSIPGFPVHHQLPEFTQTLSHWVSDVIQPSHPVSHPSSPAFNLSQHQCLPMNIQDWFPLGWTGWISLQSKGLSGVFSNTTVQKHRSSALGFLYSPTLTFIRDSWKNHSVNKMDLCWQSSVSAFEYVVCCCCCY